MSWARGSIGGSVMPCSESRSGPRDHRDSREVRTFVRWEPDSQTASGRAPTCPVGGHDGVEDQLAASSGSAEIGILAARGRCRCRGLGASPIRSRCRRVVGRRDAPNRSLQRPFPAPGGVGRDRPDGVRSDRCGSATDPGGDHHLREPHRHVAVVVLGAGQGPPAPGRVPSRHDRRVLRQGLPTFTKGTRATYRSTLVRIGGRTSEHRVRPALVGVAVVGTRDALHDRGDHGPDRVWSRGLPTEKMRDGSSAVLALGLGTGLKAIELNAATTKWVEDTEAGLVLLIPGDRPRRVPVRSRWVSAVRDAAARAQGGLLFRPERDHVNARHLTRVPGSAARG